MLKIGRKKKRKELIIAANSEMSNAEYLNLISFTQNFVSLLSNEAIHLKFETQIDELALNIDTFINFNHKILIRV